MCFCVYKWAIPPCLDLEEEKGTGDAIGMMRIIAERTMEVDEELCIAS